MTHDVFICHSSKDRTLANAICAKLEAAHIRCWIAPRDVVPGLEYAQSIVEAIASTRLTVLVFSQSANESPHIHRELERTASHGIPILPFRVEDIAPAPSVEYFISDAHWLDALTPPMEQHLEYLVGTVRLILDRQAAKTGGTAMPAAAAAATSSPDAPARPRRTMPYAVLAALALVVVAALVVVGVVTRSGSTADSSPTAAVEATGADPASPPAQMATGPTVATFTGTEDQMTAPFTVGSPWRLDWTVNATSATPLVVVVDAPSGDVLEIIGDIEEGSGSAVLEAVRTSCALDITVYGPTTYTFTVSEGS